VWTCESTGQWIGRGPDRSVLQVGNAFDLID